MLNNMEWLPITWIPATEEELSYMNTVRARQEFLNDMFIDYLRQKYENKILHSVHDSSSSPPVQRNLLEI